MKYSDLLKSKCICYLTYVALPMECMLGLPAVSYEDGSIMLSFFPHRARLENGLIAVYPAEYLFCIRAPFWHIERFTRLRSNAGAPICLLYPERISSEAKPAAIALYALLDRILDSPASPEQYRRLVEEYQDAREQIMQSLGLPALYKGGCM